MNYQVEMMIDGMPVRKVKHQGSTYLPVEAGKRFKIKVINNSNKRILAVVSVDGLSVMNGENASHSDSGYVIDRYSHVEIDGWRRGDHEVAAFDISGSEGSYADKTDRPANVGVIGVVVYAEKEAFELTKRYFAPPRERPRRPWREAPPTRLERKTRSYKGGIGGQSASMRQPTGASINCCSLDCSAEPVERIELPVQEVGTSYGEKITSHVRTVQFTKDESTKKVIVLRYDTVSALRDKGVPVGFNDPNPFPAQPDRFFCPEPE